MNRGRANRFYWLQPWAYAVSDGEAHYSPGPTQGSVITLNEGRDRTAERAEL